MKKAALLDGADHSSSLQRGTDFHCRNKRPFLIGIEGIGINPPCKEKPLVPGKDLQGVLQPIIDLSEQSRPQGGGEHLPRQFDTVANRHACRIFIDLHIGCSSMHP